MPASTTGSPSAATSVRAVDPSPGLPLPAPKPPEPPVTPLVQPQLVACGERDFYRITESALQVFEIAKELPPPQIRGGRVAVQTHEVAVERPLNVFSPASKTAVVIAKTGVLRYQLEQKRTGRYAPLPVSAPLAVWPDPRHRDAFHVRVAGEAKWRRYSLAALPSADAGSPSAPPRVAEQVDDLPGSDGRLFTVLTDGTPLFSTVKGLARIGEAPVAPFPEPRGPAAILFADALPGRYWAADASGHLALWDRKQGASPVFRAEVPGVVIDSAQEGERVAVLSMAVEGQSYRPAVAIFVAGREQARMSIGPSLAMRPPQLDVCLITGRPWVLVGGARWMQLLDWESRRLLAEW